MSKARQLSQRAFMAYEAIISCTADLLWWIQAENVAVDMVGVGKNQIVSHSSIDSITALNGSQICAHWEADFQLGKYVHL